MKSEDYVVIVLFLILGAPFVILALGQAIEGILKAYATCLERLNKLKKD